VVAAPPSCRPRPCARPSRAPGAARAPGVTVAPPGAIDHRGSARPLPAVSPEEASLALAKAASNGRSEYSIAFSVLAQAVDACSSLGEERCDGCIGRTACTAVWDRWIDEDSGNRLPRLMRRVSDLERIPGWRLPPGALHSWVLGKSPMPQANPLEFAP
jgi:hypothetical protein